MFINNQKTISMIVMKQIICEKCRSKDIYLQVPMVQIKKEPIGDTEMYKYTFECIKCSTTIEKIGTPCPFCGGAGYHCHVHYGTDCTYCGGYGIRFINEKIFKQMIKSPPTIDEILGIDRLADH